MGESSNSTLKFTVHFVSLPVQPIVIQQFVATQSGSDNVSE